MVVKTIGFFLILLTLVCSGYSQSAVEKSLRQDLDHRVESFLGVESLSPRQKDGFIYQIALREMFDDLSPELQKAALAEIYVQAPIRQALVQSPSGHFTLHYDTTANHAVPLADISGNGIPDYVDSAAVFLDHVWQVTINEMGFQAPLGIDGQTVTTYHIYFSNMSFYGTTRIDEEISNDRYTSYIEIHNTMQSALINTKGLDGLRVTSAHEFHHAVQLCYRLRIAETYFYEMSGTWMEDVIYPDINDYFFYLETFFSQVQSIAFTSTSGLSEYANCLYLHMLSKQFGNFIVVQIWQEIVRKNAMSAIETILQKYNTTFSETLNEYAKWLYFTGERAIPGEFFKDASFFEMVTIPVGAMLQSNLVVKHTFKVSPESFYYLTVDSVFTRAGLAMMEAEVNNQQLQLNYFNFQKYYTTPAAAGVDLPVVLELVPQDLVFVFSNSRDSTLQVSFTLIADSTIVPREEGSPVAYGPNPTKINDGVKSANFWSVPAFAKIIIMDFNQQPVRELKNDEFFDTPVTWDLKDKNGRIVSSGIYYYIVSGQGSKQVNKIAIVR